MKDPAEARNRLADAASAYLRSAAHQPIHWYPWGAEAFAAAASLDRPVLLDVGAVWCHWCHVMDGESYEDSAVAALLNANFVCIKVDRDERPDVDSRYQRAVQTLIHQGGWPLTAFLTPAGEVFYGGTYFPPDDRFGRPGFQTVLRTVLDVFRTRRDQVVAQAAAIRRTLDAGLDEAARGAVSPALLEDAEAQMLRAFDRVHGGFGTEPKFPHPAALLLALSRWSDDPTDERRLLVDRTLQGMARGGIRDHLGGGFHRYSVDRAWIVPHFEKMSYDNSELLRVYVAAAAALGSGEYADTARGIVRWVHEVLADPAGGYGTSQDADVGLDDDGDYFTWTRDEAAAVLTAEELEVAGAYFDIGTAGEMHHNPGKNVLFVAATIDAIALRLGRPADDVRALLESAVSRLSAARGKRPAPFVDRTRYTSWNAMMAGAMLGASALLADHRARQHAFATLQRIRTESSDPDAVPHTAGGADGLLDDQVQVAAAALDAWESSGDRSWLDWAIRIMDRVWRDYADADGALFDTARDRGGEGLLPARAKPVQDAPTPSGNGTAALVAARLHAITDDQRWDHRARALVAAFAGRAPELGFYAATYLMACDWLLNPPTHLIIVGPAGEPEADRMHARALATFAPRRVVQRITNPDAPLPPAAAAMAAAAAGGLRAFVCRAASCGAPASTDGQWAEALAGFSAPPPQD
jgi:uncharacterized protein YyaL (SSP411 family)